MIIYIYVNATHDVILQIWTGNGWTENVISDLGPLTQYKSWKELIAAMSELEQGSKH